MAKQNPTYPKISADLTAEIERLGMTITARLDGIEAKFQYQDDLISERMKPVSIKIDDHESRIRGIETDLLALRTKYDLMTGGSLAASIAAIIKVFMGL